VNRSGRKWRISTPLERVFNALQAPALWRASCFINVRIGNAVADPKEGKTMKKLTTKFMIATAALVVAAGAASAQTMIASIPFEFRAGNRVMEPGTYRVDLSRLSGASVFRLLNVNSGGQAIVLGQAPADPKETWKASGQGKLAFACTSGRCALAELWEGPDSPYVYKVGHPKLGKDETAVLREIPIERGKGE
jgi:hypothetical protein